MSRPNLLLILADQHRFDCVGVNGHPLLRTPALDRLAREGVNFTHAFTPIPVCAPARTSLLTGAWPAAHGNIANAGTEVVPPCVLTLPTVNGQLRDAGYYIAHVGKWQVLPHEGPQTYGCHDFVPQSRYTEWRAAQGLPPRPSTNGYFGETDPGITADQSALAWGADQTIALLRGAAQSDRPFFIRWDPSEPHLPNIVPEPYASQYPPSAVMPWPSFPDSLDGKPYIQRKQRRTWGIEHWSWDDWAPVVGRYLGEVALLDSQVGRILATLDALGLSADTLVVYSSDHGDLCGAHGMIDKHYVMYDDLLRVPLLVRWPGVLPAGETCSAFISSALDIAYTLCAAAGIAAPPTFSGRNLVEEMARPSRQDIFAAYYGNQMGLFSQRMVRDGRWKLVWNATAEDELYDLDSDPTELNNLAAAPGCAEEQRRLRLRLHDWMEHTGDNLLNYWTRRQLAGER
jgi:arylsulfatase A-like enzyme